MELERAYRQVEARLERIDFSALHRGFHPFPFALYSGTEAFTAVGFNAVLGIYLFLESGEAARDR